MAEIIGRADSVAAVSQSRRARVHDVRRAIIRARQWAGGLTLAFIAFSVLVGLGITGALDERVSQFAQAIGTYPIDLAASVFNVIGEMEITGLVAVILAFVWWRRDGTRGLVPLLLFAGVAIEAIMKHVLPHPGPPPELSRSIALLPHVHTPSPYSFPSGHVLRATFLAALMLDRWAFWLVAGAMAASRVYLNEHWVSDVIGGFLLGAAIAGLAASLYSDPAA